METEQSWEGGEVRGLNPDNGRAAHNVIILLKIIMGRSNTTLEPEAKISQKEIKARGRKIRGEVMVPNLNKRNITSNEIGSIQKQVDRFIQTLKSSPQTQQKREVVRKLTLDTQTPIRHHGQRANTTLL